MLIRICLGVLVSIQALNDPKKLSHKPSLLRVIRDMNFAARADAADHRSDTSLLFALCHLVEDETRNRLVERTGRASKITGDTLPPLDLNACSPGLLSGNL